MMWTLSLLRLDSLQCFWESKWEKCVCCFSGCRSIWNVRPPSTAVWAPGYLSAASTAWPTSCTGTHRCYTQVWSRWVTIMFGCWSGTLCFQFPAESWDVSWRDAEWHVWRQRGWICVQNHRPGQLLPPLQVPTNSEWASQTVPTNFISSYQPDLIETTGEN